MSGMEIPLILGAGGALVGSQVDKKNPLRGALLGGAAGGLGGAALAPASAATTAGTAAGSTAAATTGAIESAAVASQAAGVPSVFGVPNPVGAAALQTVGNLGAEQAALIAQLGGKEFGMAEIAHAAGSSYQPGSVGSGLFRALSNTSPLSPSQAMAAQRVMGGFQQPQGGTSTQTGAFRPGQQVNLADPIASLLAPKRKKERPMISLL